MPFDLHSVSATFQRPLNEILGPELEPNVLVYLDDIIIVIRHLKIISDIWQKCFDDCEKPDYIETPKNVLSVENSCGILDT